MKQITVREVNDWEGEVFNYVLTVSDHEHETIINKLEEFDLDNITVTETNYTNEQIKMLDDASDNTYMAFIAPYELEDHAVERWDELNFKLFYKGTGLKKLKVLPKKDM